jgi:hypothetical protein
VSEYQHCKTAGRTITPIIVSTTTAVTTPPDLQPDDQHASFHKRWIAAHARKKNASVMISVNKTNTTPSESSSNGQETQSLARSRSDLDEPQESSSSSPPPPPPPHIIAHDSTVVIQVRPKNGRSEMQKFSTKVSAAIKSTTSSRPQIDCHRPILRKRMVISNEEIPIIAHIHDDTHAPKAASGQSTNDIARETNGRNAGTSSYLHTPTPHTNSTATKTLALQEQRPSSQCTTSSTETNDAQYTHHRAWTHQLPAEGASFTSRKCGRLG